MGLCILKSLQKQIKGQKRQISPKGILCTCKTFCLRWSMAHLTPAEKQAIVRLSFHDGKPTRTIAREMKCSRDAVYFVLKKFRDGEPFERKHGSGRPTTTMDADMKCSLEKAIRRNRNATGSQLQEILSEQTGRRVSERTIHRARRSLGYHPVHASPKPYLTDEHMALRLAFCHAHHNNSPRRWVFMDEMGVGIDIYRNLYWIKPGEGRPIHETASSNIRINVWGAIWYEGRSTLYVTRQNFNSHVYVDALQDSLLPFLPLHNKQFIQDGATWHWTQMVTQWCEEHDVQLIEDFLPSPPILTRLNSCGVGLSTQLPPLIHTIISPWRLLFSLHGLPWGSPPYVTSSIISRPFSRKSKQPKAGIRSNVDDCLAELRRWVRCVCNMYQYNNVANN
jgi:transposase